MLPQKVEVGRLDAPRPFVIPRHDLPLQPDVFLDSSSDDLEADYLPDVPEPVIHIPEDDFDDQLPTISPPVQVPTNDIIPTDNKPEPTDDQIQVEIKPETEKDDPLVIEEEPPRKEVLPPWSFEPYESDEESVLSQIGDQARRSELVVDVIEEKRFLALLEEAYIDIDTDVEGPTQIFPIANFNFPLKLSHIRAMARFLKSSHLGRGITTFSVTNVPLLSGLALKWILGAITHHPSIHTIRIDNAKFAPLDGYRIVRFLQQNPKITSLELPNLSGSNDLVIRAILQELATNNYLKRLDIRGAEISQTTFSMLTQLLSNNTTLTYINLNGINFTSYNRAQRLMQAIVDNPSTRIERIDLPIMRGTVFYLAQMMQYNTSLAYINLSSTPLGNNALLLKTCMASNKNLRHLNLRDTSISDQEVTALMEPLWSNTTLQFLDLSQNNLGEESARNIADMLMTNVGLNELVLDRLLSMPKDKLAKKISKTFKANSTLTRLSMQNCNIEATGLLSIATGLNGNHSLVHLNLSDNPIDDSAITGFFKTLNPNHTLESLSFDNCKFGDGAVKAIVAWLKVATKLRYLSLYGNKFSAANYQLMIQTISSNPAIKNLDYYFTAEESASKKFERYKNAILSKFSF